MDAWTPQEVCDFFTERGYADLGMEMLAKQMNGAVLKATTVPEFQTEFQLDLFAEAKRIWLLVQAAVPQSGDAAAVEVVAPMPEAKRTAAEVAAPVPVVKRSRMEPTSPKVAGSLGYRTEPMNPKVAGSLRSSPKAAGKASGSRGPPVPETRAFRSRAHGSNSPGPKVASGVSAKGSSRNLPPLVQAGAVDYVRLEERAKAIKDLKRGQQNVWIKGCCCQDGTCSASTPWVSWAGGTEAGILPAG